MSNDEAVMDPMWLVLGLLLGAALGWFAGNIVLGMVFGLPCGIMAGVVARSRRLRRIEPTRSGVARRR
ncbi:MULTISPECIES: hypothetical protein [unclassified Luteimonas]|uniref:hypothetical protein n=1 Tax=Lysobacteraceae TaxID=32033 RepID=UPI00100BCB5D|nr:MULTISPECIES: hypothetical protein [unclassified Luteimonas]MCD9046356.1 hypothetical protein [Luteimonas sp. MHLX1A]